MQEFTTVSSSSFDPSALARQLTEKSADGWSVISIVSTGSDVTAFLARDTAAETDRAGASSSVATTTSSRGSSSGAPWSDSTNGASSAPAYSPATAAPPEPSVSEPSGWAVAPEPASPVAPIVDPAPSYSSNAPGYSAGPAPSYSPAPASAQPAVPAGWYGDPAGRFELRYWDGDAWTEHVSRAGQQYTDPPVA